MSNKKQTAVDWLIESIITHQLKPREIPQTIIEQAKAMEKEQHQNTYFDSTSQFSNEAYMPYVKPFEQYYKETYE